VTLYEQIQNDGITCVNCHWSYFIQYVRRMDKVSENTVWSFVVPVVNDFFRGPRYRFYSDDLRNAVVTYGVWIPARTNLQ